MKKDICPCGPQIRVGRVKEWGKVDAITVSNLFIFLLVSGKSRERRGEVTPSNPIASVPRDW